MANTSVYDLSLVQLRRAVEIREKIASLEAELTKLMGGVAGTKPVAARRGRRKMSAAGRAAIAAAQKRRWAKLKAAAARKPAK
jgi:hypothetical protein